MGVGSGVCLCVEIVSFEAEKIKEIVLFCLQDRCDTQEETESMDRPRERLNFFLN